MKSGFEQFPFSVWTCITNIVPAVRPTRLCSARAEIGVVLTGLGFVFSLLGIMFFFDRGLIALGNVRPCLHQHGAATTLALYVDLQTWLDTACVSQLMFLAGVSLTIGPQATLRFFMRRKNLKARTSLCGLTPGPSAAQSGVAPCTCAAMLRSSA